MISAQYLLGPSGGELEYGAAPKRRFGKAKLKWVRREGPGTFEDDAGEDTTRTIATVRFATEPPEVGVLRKL